MAPQGPLVVNPAVLSVRTLAFSTGVLLALGWPVAASPQEQEPATHDQEVHQEDGATASPIFVEEVVVTAQKREQHLQDVPISIQMFSGSEIATLGATRLIDLRQSATSFSVGGLIGSSYQQAMGLRGIVDYSRNTGTDGSMGVYVDGVFQGRSYSADQSLLGLERVEILRGPQGTLFGKNTVSGAVNLVTKVPTSETEVELRAEQGSYGLLRGAAYVAGALGEKVFGSLSVGYEEADGYYRNVTLGKDTGAHHRHDARGKLCFVPSDALEIVLAADVASSFSNSPLAVNRSLPPFQSQQSFEAQDEVDFWGTALTIDYHLPSGYEFTSITSYRESEFDILYDSDITPFDIQTTSFNETSAQVTQELRVLSPRDHRYDWVAGVYYYDAELGTDRAACFGEDLFNLLIPTLAPYASALSGCVAIPSTVDVTSRAAYLHGNYRFTDRLELTAGMRFTSEDKAVDWRQISYPNDPATAAALEAATGLPLSQSPGALFGAVNSSVADERSESDLSPTVGLSFFPSTSTLLYGKYSRGFKSGGFNTDFMTAGLDYFQYDTESVDAYEVGIKSTTAGGRLIANATAFVSKFKDLQVFQFVTTSKGETTLQLTNAAAATSQGLELEGVWVPAAPLQLRFNLTILDATYDRFANPVPGEPDFDGNALPYAPDWKVFIGLRYTLTLGQRGALTFNADYSSVGDQFSDPSNTEAYLIESYDLVDARVSYAPVKGAWELFLWSKNLTDEVYHEVNDLSFLGAPRTTWGAPRTVGVGIAFSL